MRVGFAVSPPEKVNYWRGKARMRQATVFNEFEAMDLTQTITSIEIPIYFFAGVHDYTCPYPLVQAYYEALDAPEKGFFSFSESAHSPLWEEPERFMNYVRTQILPDS